MIRKAPIMKINGSQSIILKTFLIKDFPISRTPLSSVTTLIPTRRLPKVWPEVDSKYVKYNIQRPYQKSCGTPKNRLDKDPNCDTIKAIIPKGIKMMAKTTPKIIMSINTATNRSTKVAN